MHLRDQADTMRPMLLAILLGGVLADAVMSSTSPPASGERTCARPAAGAPIFVTEDCIDPKYNEPFIDVNEMRDTPVRHRYVHGGFKGTDAKFSFAFPPSERYQQRFFEYTHQGFNETLPPATLAFAVTSGAYMVQTNQGGADNPTGEADLSSGRWDASTRGYRINAAAAKFSRVVAREIYGDHRPYGYLTGSSGGGLQTKAGLEHTVGVWDGGVARVSGTPNLSPNKFEIWVHARRVLNDKWPSIIDAVEPGGGDMFAGLNEQERTALLEVTRYGFPPRAWVQYVSMGAGILGSTPGAERVRLMDPTYVDDFWTKPGYLGTDPASGIAKARFTHETTVLEVVDGSPKRLKLGSLPAGDLVLTLPDIVVLSGAAQGQIIPLANVDRGTNTVGMRSGGDPAVLNRMRAGDRVRIDNSFGLAVQTHYCHQLPEAGSYLDHPTNDQWRGPFGEPRYPQRSVLVGPQSEWTATGSDTLTGRFSGKLIYLQNLVDGHAYAWEADWYRKVAEKAQGQRHVDENFRIWYTDHAGHGGPGKDTARLIDWTGVIEQALLDMSAWVEKGVPPPASNRYEVVDGQVNLPANAAIRGGVQPVVELTVNGGVRAEVAAGQPVTFTAKIEVPRGTGTVVAAEWDFLGVGNYPTVEKLGTPRAAVTLKTTYTFSKPGTYFPVLRAVSQRNGDAGNPYGRIQNLGRVRVVVKTGSGGA